MTYNSSHILKDGRTLLIRNGVPDDGKAVCDLFTVTHSETDYLLAYPEENSHTAEKEAEFLAKKTESENEIELMAVVDGTIAGVAGIEAVGAKYKVRHRAEFWISVVKDCWGLGIGRALTDACIECAKAAGYAQLELSAVASNARALSLYRSAGFIEFGRNPRGFNSRTAGYQELVYMRLELEQHAALPQSN